MKAFLSLSNLLIDPHNPKEIIYVVWIYKLELHCVEELEKNKCETFFVRITVLLVIFLHGFNNEELEEAFPEASIHLPSHLKSRYFQFFHIGKLKSHAVMGIRIDCIRNQVNKITKLI